MRSLLRRLDDLEKRKAPQQSKPWHFCGPRDRGGINECLGDECPLGEDRHAVRCIVVTCTRRDKSGVDTMTP